MGEEQKSETSNLRTSLKLLPGGLSATIRLMHVLVKSTVRCVERKSPEVGNFDGIDVVEDTFVTIEYNSDGEIIRETIRHRKTTKIIIVSFVSVLLAMIYYYYR